MWRNFKWLAIFRSNLHKGKNMPNKKKGNQARNAFYFFMVSLRPQLERQGVVLENGMQSLAEIAGPRWKVSQRIVLNRGK